MLGGPKLELRTEVVERVKFAVPLVLPFPQISSDFLRGKTFVSSMVFLYHPQEGITVSCQLVLPHPGYLQQLPLVHRLL
jgi:hypothetical protein